MKGVFSQLVVLGELRHFQSVDLKSRKVYMGLYNEQAVKISIVYRLKSS